MARSPIQRREALAIARKLGASLDRDGPHQLATDELGGQIILSFGIRHGRTSGHSHLVGRYGELKMNQTRVLRLAQCTISADEYFDHLREIGELN